MPPRDQRDRASTHAGERSVPRRQACRAFHTGHRRQASPCGCQFAAGLSRCALGRARSAASAYRVSPVVQEVSSVTLHPKVRRIAWPACLLANIGPLVCVARWWPHLLPQVASAVTIALLLALIVAERLDPHRVDWRVAGDPEIARDVGHVIAYSMAVTAARAPARPTCWSPGRRTHR